LVLQAMCAAVRAKPDLPVTIDLQTLSVAWGNEHAPFVIDPGWRERLLNGWDEIDATLAETARIQEFVAVDRTKRPWARPKRRSQS
jgi:3-isopropylmalate/(R)-2-methylmalate dehydratase small subunit